MTVAAATFDGAGVLGLGFGSSVEFALSGPAYFVLMSGFLAAMADRLARLRLAASTDPLTGLANRAVLFDRLSLEIARARRHAHPVALGILDLDGFKEFNDRHGHVAGDRLLVAAGRALTDVDPRHGPGRPLRRGRVRRPPPGVRRDPGRRVPRADPRPRRAREGRGR